MSDKWLLASSRIATVFSAGAAGKDINDADATASNAVQNNYLKHDEAIEREKARKSCSEGNMESCSRVAELDALDEKTDKEIQAEVAACGTGKSGQDCLRDLYQNKYKSIMEEHMEKLSPTPSGFFKYFNIPSKIDKSSGAELGDLFKSVFVSPNGVDVDQNIQSAPRDPLSFYLSFQTGGKFDFKKNGGQFENFGNFNYGAVGTETGFPPFALFMGAGSATTEKTSEEHPEWGTWYSPFDGYGDDPDDIDVIKKGIFYKKKIFEYSELKCIFCK